VPSRGRASLSSRWPFLSFAGIAALLLLALTSAAVAAGETTLVRLTVNGRANPLGIPAKDISFGWSAASTGRGVMQQAYQIRVGTSAGSQDVWDSGQVQSDRQTDVVLPSGVSLKPATRYYWQVRIWDGAGNASDWSAASWFETGLLAESDWSDAQWIARPRETAPNPADWTNYTAIIDFTVQKQALGVFLRSSADAQNAYMMQVNVAGSTPVLKVHKRTGGTYTVLATIDLSQFGFTNAALTGAKNTLQFDVSGSTITTKLNGIAIDTRSGIAYSSGLVGFRTAGTEAGIVQRIQVMDKASGRTVLNPNFAKGENGFSDVFVLGGVLSISGDSDAIFTNAAPSLPLLRGKFVAREGIASARVYASAQGLYEISVNGRKAGDQVLAPGWTDYNKRIQSQTYDVTDLVHPGANVIGAALGDGWFRGSVGIGLSRVYGNQLAFVAKVRITYLDGTSDWFATDLSWKTGNSPFVRGDLQDGEIYDASFEQAGWDTATFDDSQWANVVAVTSDSARLVPQSDEPIRQSGTLTAQSRTEILPGTWIYDLGQNMVGIVKLRLSGKKGDVITLRHGEELYRTGAQKGQLYTENLRGAEATDRYVFAADGTVTYQPRFTQHGFRYIEITGATAPPAAADVQGAVLGSDLVDVGDLQTSSALLNQLVSNIRWGQRGNFLSIPTDTPARDERLGWTGDINVFAPAAARYKDTRAFLSKWMADVRDAQKANGNIPAVVPQPLNEFDATGVGWSDAFITVPYAVWHAFGDAQIVRANWGAMKTFYNFVYTSATSDGDLLEQGRSSWFSGDWLSLEAGWNRLEEHKVIATAYFAEDTRMMAEMATAMGETTLAAQWSALVPRIRSAFVTAYCRPDGSIYQGTQAVYAMALGMDLIADPAQRALTAAKFVQKLAADNYHLQTGFLGTPWLLPALTKIGRNDLAMRLLLNQDYPSWGFPITIGATTMWERWNSINPDLTFGPVDMNSFNHYAYGAVGDWMFENLGGIQAQSVGYKAVRIAPLIGYGGLTSAKCSQQTAFGSLVTEWSVSGGTISLKVDVPVNTTATVCLPATDGAGVKEGSIAANTAPGVQFLRTENGAAVYGIGSGSYMFTWAPRLDAPSFLTAVADSGKVSLSWTGTLGAAGYDIQRSTVAGGPYTTIARGVADTNYIDASAINGVTYYYVVTAQNSSGASDPSAQVSGRPAVFQNAGFETPPTTSFLYNPTGGGWTFGASSGSNGSGVAANGSTFTSGNANAPEGTQVAFLQGTGAISQTFNGLTPGLTYHILFAAAQRATGASWNASGQTWKVTVDGGTVANFAPGQSATSYANYAASFTATAASHKVAFVGTNERTGDNTVFIDDVRLVRSSPTGLLNSSFESPALSTYRYSPGSASWTFRAQSGTNGSGIARNGSVFTAGNPNAPEGVQVAFLQGTGTITQTVSGLTPGQRYLLLFSSAQRATYVNDGQTWNVTLDGTAIASFKPGASTTAYSGYAASFTATATTHTLAFIGTNTNGGDNTAFLDDVRLIPGAPAIPSGLSVVAGNKQAQLSWIAASGVTGYLITRSSAGGADVTFAVDAAQTTFTDPDLANKTAYTYRVAAIDESGAGPPSTSGTATPLAPPVSDSERAAPLCAVTSDSSGNQRAVITVPNSTPGHFYTLQYCDDLAAGNWQAIPDASMQEGTGGSLQFYDPLSSTRQRFFRVVIQD
jgi:alpha-L-rhamnosidase